MNKILQIVYKDLIVTFQDRAALLLMIVAPLLLTVAMGTVTGSFSDETEGLSAIAVVLVNQDQGEIGPLIENILTSPTLASLITLTKLTDITAAREQVETDQVVAAVIIPPEFSKQTNRNDSSERTSEDVIPIEIYANPGSPISANVVQIVLQEIVRQIDQEKIAVQLITNQLITTQRLTPAEGPTFVDELVQQNTSNTPPPLLTLQRVDIATRTFDILAILAPGLAVFFLMYTVFQGGRSILLEQEGGTMARLLTTPTTVRQIIAGKMVSTFLTGLIQVGGLITACVLFFGLNWGHPFGVALLVIAVVAAATSWGMLLPAVAKTANEVATAGSAMMLLFGILGGGFISIPFTGIMYFISHLTPNAWATDGFLTLATGGTLTDLAPTLAALFGMAATLFIISTTMLQRRWV